MSMSMSADDAAYTALLAQLLSDSAISRNARVHSWIEHQYDFALSEQSSSRPPSPSPSSSLGAHRAHSVDRPDSPLLPRLSSERSASPCPSYDALFFPSTSHTTPEDDDFEEHERLRALRFIVQEMAHWNTQTTSSHHERDSPLSAPPPSPASSLAHSTCSRVVRSCASSTRISRLPSFTSTLSSEQSQPQEMPPPLPVSVIVHGEYQHDLVLRHDRPIVDGCLHGRGDSISHSQDHDAQLLCPTLDDKDSVQPSPTLSSFSSAYSRESLLTTPYASSLASPTSVVFSSSLCSPENIALPASPVDDQAILRDAIVGSIHQRTSSYKISTSLGSLAASTSHTNVSHTLPSSLSFPNKNSSVDGPPRRLRAFKSAEHSQSRWSVATTVSGAPSAAEPKPAALLGLRTPPKEKKDKGSKSPKKRTRFISLISRFSPGRTDTSRASQSGGDVEYDSANDSDADDKERMKQERSLSKKSSLASLRASFSISRPSFSSQRPAMSFSIDEAPPLPTSPTLVSPQADSIVPLEVAPLVPTMPLSRIPSRANIINAPLPPVPQSPSTITTFQSPSQLSVSDASVVSPFGSLVSLVGPNATPNASRISLVPASNKRTSLASAAGIEPMSASQTVRRSKSIFRLAAAPKSLKTPPLPGSKGMATPSRLPVAGNPSLPSTASSRIPQAPSRFNPPAKLASVIATQSQPAYALALPGSTPATRLPMPPSRVSPKVPRSITTTIKVPAESLPSPPTSSKLPTPASAKGVRVGTVKGFWKRQ